MLDSNLISAIVNQTFEFIGVLTLDGMLLEANQSALDYLGIQLEQVQGQPFWQTPWWTHSLQQQQQLYNAIDKAKSGQLVRCEVTHRSACGSIETFDFSIKPLRSETGESSFLICEGRNINQRKQSEQRLQAAYTELEVRMADSLAELLQIEIQLHQEIQARQQAQIERQSLLKQAIAASAEVEAVKTQITYLLERITDGFLAVNRDWRFTYINPQGVQLLQRSPSELIGKNIWEVFPDEVNSLSYQEFHRAVAEQVSLGFETYCSPLNAWFKFHLYPSANGLSVYFRNITACKQAEATLRASEERYRSVVAALQEGIIVQSANFIILACNKSAAQILGLSQDQMLGRSTLNPSWRTIHEDGSPFPCELYPSFVTLRTGQPCSNVIMGVYHPDETLKWISINSQPLFTVGEPLPYAVVTSFTDISERKQAEQKIREQAALLDVASDAIYVCNLSSQIEFWNQGAERLYGWQQKEALGKNVVELLFQSQPSDVSHAPQTLYETGKWQDEIRKITKSGKDVTVISRLTLVRDPDGSPRSILTVDTDITEKKQLEAQFLRAQRLESIGTLASGIAHDLNNILTPVLSIAQLLSCRFPNADESTRHLLEILETNAKRGGDLVKQVLSFARGCNGQRTPLQVGHLLSEVAKIAQQTFPKSIEIQSQISTRGLWLVHGDATQLHQVIVNLCVNARDAMPDGGTLTIAAENCTIDATFVQMHTDAQIGSYIKLTITDTGTGIAPDVLDQIFDSFFTTKLQGKGTGLGLPTVMTIIKNHGGVLNVATQVGRGTTFTIYLPAIKQGEVGSIDESNALDGNGELILVVDDELPIRQTLKTTLESHHYQAIVAQDGIDGLALHAQHKDDIRAVLLDLMMPTADGIKLITALLEINPQLPLIAMSGSVSGEEKASINDSVQALLAKPFTTKTLLQTLRQALAKKH